MFLEVAICASGVGITLAGEPMDLEAPVGTSRDVVPIGGLFTVFGQVFCLPMAKVVYILLVFYGRDEEANVLGVFSGFVWRMCSFADRDGKLPVAGEDSLDAVVTFADGAKSSSNSI